MTTPRRIFVICPRFRTGGPENAHQLVDHLNAIGADAYIVYHPNPDRDYSLLYPEFTRVKVSDFAYDAPDSLMVVPEIYTIADARSEFPTSTIALWWLSYVNAVIEGTAGDNMRGEAGAIHLFHSYYEYAMIRPHLSWTTPWFFLTDCIHDDFLALDPDTFADGKQDLVCFNGNKDLITERICAEAGIEAVPLRGMTRAQVLDTMRRCKVYVDNGYHPGKDHLPREAAMNGCVVITNKSGSAAYHEDVPIDEKVTLETDLYDLIPAVFADFRHYYDNQRTYREHIRAEKRAFQANAESFWRQVCDVADSPDGSL